MRSEKKYLVEEVARHLEKSNFVFLTNYRSIKVDEIAELRDNLAAQDAEFHVVKNSALKVAARERHFPDLGEWLAGPTAIVLGGRNPSGVAKILKKFIADKSKMELKAGVLGDKVLTKPQIEELADLPSLEELRARLVGMLAAPSQRFVTVLNAVPTAVVTVLKAKADKGGA